MKTMEEVIRDRMLEVCEAQLRAAKRALGGANRAGNRLNRAQTVLTITPERPTAQVTVRPLVQRGWYEVWSK